jgi:hypothetical protein
MIVWKTWESIDGVRWTRIELTRECRVCCSDRERLAQRVQAREIDRKSTTTSSNTMIAFSIARGLHAIMERVFLVAWTCAIDAIDGVLHLVICVQQLKQPTDEVIEQRAMANSRFCSRNSVFCLSHELHHGWWCWNASRWPFKRPTTNPTSALSTRRLAICSRSTTTVSRTLQWSPSNAAGPDSKATLGWFRWSGRAYSTRPEPIWSGTRI